MEFKTSYGMQNVRKTFDLLEGEEFARYYNDVYRLSGREEPFENPEQYGEGTDWQDALFRPAPVQNYQLSFRGGSENTTYAVTGGYTNEGGVVRSSSFERGSFQFNLNSDLTDRLTLGTNLILSRAIRHTLVGGITSADRLPPISLAARFPPIIPVKNEEGEYARPRDFDFFKDLPFAEAPNPIAQAVEPTQRQETTRGLGNAFVALELIEGLRLKSSLGIDYRQTRDESYLPLNRGLANSVNSAGIGSVQRISWLLENTLSYERTFAERHRIEAVTGYTIQEVTNENVNASARDFLNDYFKYNNLGVAANPLPPGSNAAGYALQSYLGRVNYTLDDRYLFTLTGRIDGSSRFGEGNKYGLFPSGAVAWRASEEEFIQDLGIFSNLKLRTSYGITGNQQIGNYLSLARFGPSSYAFGGQRAIGIGPRSIANPDLKWERSAQFDVGLNVGFLDNRLTLTADYYYKITNDLLLGVNVPYTTGFASTIKNIGSVLNEGLELSLGVRNAWGDFRWEASANFATNRNEVLELGPDTDQIIISVVGGPGRGSASIIKEGYPLGAFYTFVYEGLWQSQEQIDRVGTMPNAKPGYARYKDVNGDGTFNTGDLKIIPTALPDFTYGMSNTFSYKGLNLSVFIQGQYGNQIMDIGSFRLRNPNAGGNIREDVDYWMPDDPDANTHRPRLGYAGTLSTKYLEDGSYLRVKNLTLGYSLPTGILGFGGVREARVYVQAKNLLTITGYSGLDPEVNTYGRQTGRVGYDHEGHYPATRTYTVGMNLTF